MNAKVKRDAYFTNATLSELREEAARQGRSLSWLIQRAWTLAKDRIRNEARHDEPHGRIGQN